MPTLKCIQKHWFWIFTNDRVPIYHEALLCELFLTAISRFRDYSYSYHRANLAHTCNMVCPELWVMVQAITHKWIRSGLCRHDIYILVVSVKRWYHQSWTFAKKNLCWHLVISETIWFASLALSFHDYLIKRLIKTENFSCFLFPPSSHRIESFMSQSLHNFICVTAIKFLGS